MTVTPQELYAATEATWPPATATATRMGPWTIRFGAGGGKRVSAATAEAPFGAVEIDLAEEAMLGLGQSRLFMIRDGDDGLDAALEARGYQLIDPVVAYAMPLAALPPEPLPRLAGFDIWPPLAVQRDLWAEGGIGPDRVAVMDRVTGPKTAIFGRAEDRPAGTAFIAVDKKVAMIHAIEVAPSLRRRQVGRNMLRHAGAWAQNQGAKTLSLLVTRANVGANALYSSLGMRIVGRYHYRIL